MPSPASNSSPFDLTKPPAAYQPNEIPADQNPVVQQQQVQQLTPTPIRPQNPGPVSKAGGIAFIANSLLRGAAQGRQASEVRKVMQTKRLMDGMNGVYNQAAERLYTLTASGADPNSPEIVKARNERDTAWAAYVDLTERQLGDKKSKGKKSGKSSGGGGQDENPAQLIASQNPEDKLRGLLMIHRKAGPPDEARLAQLNSPEAVAARKTRAVEQQRDATKVQNEAGLEQRQARYAELQNKDPKTMTDDLRAELARLNEDKELFPRTASSNIPHYSTFSIPGAQLSGKKDPSGNPMKDAFGNEFDPKANYRVETMNGEEKYFPAVATGAASKPKVGWSKDSHGRLFSASLDPATNQFIPGTENYNQQPPPGMMTTVRQGYYTYTDAAGNVTQVPVTTTTSKVAPGSGGGGSGGGTAHAAGSGVSRGGGGGSSAPKRTLEHSTQSRQDADVKSSLDAASETGDTRRELLKSLPPGSRIIGKKETNADKRLQASAIKYSDTLKPLTALLNEQEAYIDGVHKNHSTATPRQDIAMVVAAVRAMNPGSVRLPAKELELEVKAGSWGDRAKRQYENATTGLLPDDQRDDLFRIVKNETTQAGKIATQEMRQQFPNTPLPAHLERYAKDLPTTPGNGTPPNPSSPGTPKKKFSWDDHPVIPGES